MRLPKLKALGSRGAAHILIPGLAILIVAVVGTFLLVSSQAATVNPAAADSTIYRIYSAGGTYKSVTITASTGFPNAKCANKKLGSSGATFKTPTTKDSNGKYNPLLLSCISPGVGQGYAVTFHGRDKGQADVRTALNSTGTYNCVFVHVTGITHIIPKSADGQCSPETVAAEADTVGASKTGDHKQATVHLKKFTISKTGASISGTLTAKGGMTSTDCAGTVISDIKLNNKTVWGLGTTVSWDISKKTCSFVDQTNHNFVPGKYTVGIRFTGNNTLTQNTHTTIARTIKADR